MTYRTDRFDKTVIELLTAGGVGILKTDTIYGIVGIASDRKTVERIYAIKKRTPSKPPIVLIAETKQTYDVYDETIRQILAPLWPGKNSIILPAPTAPNWLTRGGRTLAYRLPDDDKLRALITASGPLIAPSANPEDLAPAEDINRAYAYFGEAVDFYVDGGPLSDLSPSKLFKLHDDGSLERLR